MARGNSWPDWYDDRNPIRAAGKIFVHFLPAMIVATAICSTLVLVSRSISNPSSSLVIGSFGELIVSVILVTLINSFIAFWVGLGACILTASFDWSVGKVMRPTWYGAAVVGCSAIPTAIYAVILEAFSQYPDSEFFIYRTYIGMISIAAAIGIYRASALVGEFQEQPAEVDRFQPTQVLIALTWVGFGCLLGWFCWEPLLPIAAAVYFTTILVVLFIHQALIRFRIVTG